MLARVLGFASCLQPEPVSVVSLNGVATLGSRPYHLAVPLTISSEQREPDTVVVTFGSHTLTYTFKGQVDGFANAWERVASFAHTLAGEPPTLAALTMMEDAKRTTQAILQSGDELAFCAAMMQAADRNRLREIGL